MYSIALLGFHNRWNRAIGVRHPNLWIFIRQLKDEQRRCQRIVRDANRGHPPPKRKRRFRLLQERLTRLKTSYRNGNNTLEEYWKAVSHAVHEFS